MTGRHLPFCLVLALVFGLFFGPATQANAAALPIIIQLSPNASIGNVLNLVGGTLVDSIPGTNQHLVNLSSIPSLQTILGLLGSIDWIDLNVGVRLGPIGQLGVLRIGPTGAADWYKNQPSMRLIKSQQALQYSQGDRVVVADINSQFDYSHPALRGHLTAGYDFVSSEPSNETALNQSSSEFLDQSSSTFLDQSSSEFLDQSSSEFLDSIPLLGSSPAYSHGTLCAGIIAVMAPDAMIMPLRAFDDDGSSDTFVLAKAIRFAVNHGAQVINMSFGTLADNHAVRSAIDYARSRNVVLVASAGNNNTSLRQYPAAYTGVMAVAATNLQDVKAYFSNYGSYVEVDAPGVNVISAYPGGLYSMVSGTSFSAPMVAATAALVRSKHSSGVAATISATTVNIDARNPQYAGKLGTGRINVLGSVSQ